MGSSLQMFFLFVLFTSGGNASEQMTPLPFTWCGEKVKSVVVDGRTLSSKEIVDSRRCDPMLGNEAAKRVSVDAAPGKTVSSRFEGGVLKVRTK
jgi:hypothetical protein